MPTHINMATSCSQKAVTRLLSSATRPTSLSCRAVTIPVIKHTSRSTIRSYHQLRNSRPAFHPVSKSFTGRVERRTIFIQPLATPNEDAIQFKPNHRILPEDFPATFLEYTSPRSTLAPPHPSPLAAALMNVDGVMSVFFGTDYITVTKDSGANWAHIKPEVFSLITEFITSGRPIITASADKSDVEKDSLAPSDDDSEVVSMIKELLETRIRPAIQDDGGDIDYRGFENGTVYLKLVGACRTCDSSTVTLKNGIEAMLQHYIPEVEGIEQVLDEEEEVAMKEFQRFEDMLRSQGRDPPADALLDKVN